MAENPTVYEWECPICRLTRVGLSYRAPAPVEDQACTAIEAHVRQSTGRGHGEEGKFPPGFTFVEITEYVRFQEQGGSRVPEGKG